MGAPEFLIIALIALIVLIVVKGRGSDNGVAGTPMYCLNCGSVAKPKRFTKGSIWTEIFLYILMILPGVLYTLWRLTSKYTGCPRCGAPNMIPTTSPKAVAALTARPTPAP